MWAVWVLVAGFLVMFMQVGFAMVETGFTRAKNAVNTMAMNLIVYPIGVLGFWLVGYGLLHGGVAGWPSLGHRLIGAQEIGPSIGGHHLGLFGAARFALLTAPHDPANLTMFLFSAVFYPLSVYPGWLQVVVECSPLYQGVALMRELDSGTLGIALLAHVAYLAAMGLGGLRLATARLGKLLLP